MLLGHVGEDLRFARAFFLAGKVACVKRRQAVMRGADHDAEIIAHALYPRHIVGKLRGIGAALLRRLPAGKPSLLDGNGERFVERRIVLHVNDLVRELVKDEARELGVAVADESRQDRIVEPAERRIRRHAGHVNVVPFGHQAGRLGAGIGFGEIAPILNTSGNRKAPLPRRQRQRRCCKHIPDDIGTPDVGITRVAAIFGQREIVRREGPHRLNLSKLSLEQAIRHIAHDFGDWTRTRKQLVLAGNTLPVELGCRTAGQREGEGDNGHLSCNAARADTRVETIARLTRRVDRGFYVHRGN